MTDLLPLVPFLAPPVVGAAIGYITNDLAIKMLFRPLEEKRVFGVRVPFTPGILPRQRHKLADNIGRMVARELLTEQIVRDRIRRDDFRLSVRASVAAHTEAFLSSRVSDLAAAAHGSLAAGSAAVDPDAVLPDGVADPYAGCSPLARLAGTAAARFAGTAGFESLLRRAVDAALDALADKTLEDILGDDAKDRVLDLYRRLSALVARPEASARLSDAAAAWASSFLEQRRPLSEVLGPDAAAQASKLADACYPTIVEMLLRFLSNPETRKELESAGRDFLRDAIFKLNAVQRLFLTAGQYERTLAERMPEIVDDLISRVASLAGDEDSRLRFSRAAGSTAARYLELDAAEAAAALRVDLPEAARSLAGAAGSALADEANRDRVAAWLAKALEPLTKKTMARLAEEGFSVDLRSAGSALASAALAAVRRNPGPAVARGVDGILAEIGDSPVGRLADLSADDKGRIDAFLADRLLEVVDSKIASALATLDVRRLVAERIDSLDMESVERIVLDVMSDQFRWINVFGAILGAVIGLSQVALTFIGR